MKRIPELDALRGLAAIGIVAMHMAYPSVAYDRLLYTGVISLDLFFVLSGFLITTIILQNVERPGFLRVFYFRRGLRIWPIYYLMVALGTLLVLVRPSMGHLSELPKYLTYTQHITLYWSNETRHMTYFLSPTWSLAIEEQFYILWPLLLLALARRPRWMLLAAMAGIAVLSPAMRLSGFRQGILIARADGFALGGLLAYVLLWARGEPSRTRRVEAALVALAVGMLAVQVVGKWMLGMKAFGEMHGPTFPVDITLNSLLFCGVVGVAVLHQGARWLAPLRVPVLCFVGTISYGIYLYHLLALYLVSVVVTKLGLDLPLWVGVAWSILTISLMSVASWYVIERPLLSLKDRICYDVEPATTSEPEPEADAAAIGYPAFEAAGRSKALSAEAAT